MKQIGRYTLLQELGRGATGLVFLAQDPQGERVALKLLTPTEAPDPRTQRELEALSRLEHPHLVRVLDHGRHGNQVWITMTLLPGGSLDHRLRTGGPLPPRRAAELCRELADGLAQVHSAGLLHRDIKPQNVMFDARGQPVLVDFGLVKLIDQDDRLTQTGQILGTPHYMSPEQADGDVRAIGPAADLYGLGGTLYAMLTGEPPHRGRSQLAILTSVLTGKIEPVRSLRPEVPARLEAICSRCLRREPGERYASAADLADDLDAFLAVGSASPRRTGSAPVLAAVVMIVAAGLAAAALLANNRTESPRPHSPTGAPNPGPAAPPSPLLPGERPESPPQTPKPTTPTNLELALEQSVRILTGRERPQPRHTLPREQAPPRPPLRAAGRPEALSSLDELIEWLRAQGQGVEAASLALGWANQAQAVGEPRLAEQARLRVLRLLVESGRHKRAIHEVNWLTRQRGLRLPEITFRVSEIKLQEGDLEGARELLEPSARAHSVPAACRYAEVMLERGEPQLALEILNRFERVIEQPSDGLEREWAPRLRYQRTRASERLGRIEEGLADCERLLAEEPGRLAVLLLQVRLLERGARGEEAGALLAQVAAAKDLPLGGPGARQAEFLTARAEARIRLSQQEAAVKDCALALSFAWRKHYQTRGLGFRALWDLGREAETRQAVERTLADRPLDARALTRLAWIQLGAGEIDDDQALAVHEAVLERLPGDVGAWSSLGQVHNRRQDLRGMKQAARRIIQLDPTSRVAYVMRATLAAQNRDLSGALTAYREVERRSATGSRARSMAAERLARLPGLLRER